MTYVEVPVVPIYWHFPGTIKGLLCDTTPRCASVATNGLWHVAARIWHEPPPDTCSEVSVGPSHSRSIKS